MKMFGKSIKSSTEEKIKNLRSRSAYTYFKRLSSRSSSSSTNTTVTSEQPRMSNLEERPPRDITDDVPRSASMVDLKKVSLDISSMKSLSDFSRDDVSQFAANPDDIKRSASPFLVKDQIWTGRKR